MASRPFHSTSQVGSPSREGDNEVACCCPGQLVERVMHVSTRPLHAYPLAAVNLSDASQDSGLVRPRESALLANWDMRHFRATGSMKSEVAWLSEGAAAATAAAAAAVAVAASRLSTIPGRPWVVGTGRAFPRCLRCSRHLHQTPEWPRFQPPPVPGLNSELSSAALPRLPPVCIR
ncbi:hypothetical protein BGZ61DRAFT_471129 [Ilyonectria robusta]|uniref:uncharacterized protein n=1 Tax=Ilyonectria robusta TaxID=1079257 RepID=UPI001E8E688D|nr:uncharacterized protein BGZ61DRAFT_471129 [Ilyonectria robusta]KAH8737720.1 hypothetical protein BGZ61DRAFT_471129 [Ilyonectria robusta]